MPRSSPGTTPYTALLIGLLGGLAGVVAGVPWGATPVSAVMSDSPLPGDTAATGQPTAVTLPASQPRRGLFVTRSPSGDADAGIIVQFDASPIVVARKRGFDLREPRRQYDRFTADLRGLAGRIPGGARRVMDALASGRRFEFAFNGAALRASRELTNEIRALPYVSGVFPDDTVRALLSESVPLIGADSVWAMGATGSGIEVGIIDTGIDYNHPALGGGFGPGFRVIAGYDFVNNDADPMDDHGHGTHVAGIVGANAPALKGVAPDVKFHAYKALHASGFGLASWLLAAIDRSVDPDQDPLTQDAVDVINLSLGGPGNPDDPLSQAVDNAVAAGVVCAVAAGNGGSSYFTISSPGTSRRAITVGASDKSDVIAGFSSTGPSNGTYAIKPDLVAPGVSITSAWPGGGQRALSGTSMASPHVAGAAALLRQLHPGWTPETVKSALMNTAHPLAVDPFQGAGRIDVRAAARPRFVVRPGSLSFGMAPAGLPVWTREETLQVDNVDADPLTVTFTTDPFELPTGATLMLTPTVVTLAPGASGTVTARLRVDRSVVPNLLDPPNAYTGTITASAGATTHLLPFAFLKAPQLTITLDTPGVDLTIHNRSTWVNWLVADADRLTLLLPPDTYDIMATYLPGFGGPYEESRVLREGIVLADSAAVSFARSDAIYEFTFDTSTETGAPIACDEGLDTFVYAPAGHLYLTIWSGVRPLRLRFSPMSSSYLWSWMRHATVGAALEYDFRGFETGITGSRVLRNDPDSLRHLSYQYRVEGMSNLFVLHELTNGPDGHPRPGGGFDLYRVGLDNGPDHPPLGPPLVKEVFFMPAPDPDFPGNFSWTLEGLYREPSWGIGSSTHLLDTPHLNARAGQPVRGFLADSIPTFTLATDVMRIGYGPPFWFGRFNNTAERMVLSAALGYYPWLFLSQQGDWKPHPSLPYQLDQGGVLIQSGTLDEAGTYNGYPVRRTIAPGAYTLKVTGPPYTVGGQTCSSQAQAFFDTRGPDKNPPYLTSFSILADGVPSDVVNTVHTTSRVVRFRLVDDEGLRSATLAYRPAGSGVWTPLALTPGAQGYEANLPEGTTGYVSLRISGDDAAGNSLTYTVEPAVRLDATTIDVRDTTVAAARALEPTLGGAVPNPSAHGLRVSFALPDRQPTTLELIDTAGRIVLHRRVDALGPGAHVVDLGLGRTWPAGIYWVRLRRDDRVLSAKVCVLR